MRVILDMDDNLIHVDGTQWMNPGQLRRYISTLERMLKVQKAAVADLNAAAKAAQPAEKTNG